MKKVRNCMYGQVEVAVGWDEGGMGSDRVGLGWGAGALNGVPILCIKVVQYLGWLFQLSLRDRLGVF